MSEAYHQTHKMADLLLSDRGGNTERIGPNWVTRFIKRHDDIASKYNRKHDYQRAQCEDPDIIKNWFSLVQNTTAKYGIFE